MICTVCGVSKRARQFTLRRGRGISRRRRQCKSCFLQRRRAAWKLADKKRNRARRIQWRTDDGYRKRNREAGKRYRLRHHRKLTIKSRQRYRAMKSALIVAYGGKCDCCSENRLEFLAFDHRNGGGTKERQKLPSYSLFHKLLRMLPRVLKKYRLLCHNCNMSFGFYGYCPHLENGGFIGMRLK